MIDDEAFSIKVIGLGAKDAHGMNVKRFPSLRDRNACPRDISEHHESRTSG
jgi:hypothetical protein